MCYCSSCTGKHHPNVLRFSPGRQKKILLCSQQSQGQHPSLWYKNHVHGFSLISNEAPCRFCSFLRRVLLSCQLTPGQPVVRGRPTQDVRRFIPSRVFASLHRQHSKNMKHNLTACFVHVIFFEAMRPFFSFETRGTTTPPPSERKRPGVGLLRTY